MARLYYFTLDELENGGVSWDPAVVDPVIETDAGPSVPRRCVDCGRPAYYDLDDDTYHHAIDADRGCFLIPPEDRDDDAGHPLVVAI